jgi:hypothetical protein
VLARLHQTPEVLLAEVEQTGRVFRVQLSSPIASSSLFSSCEELEQEPIHARWFSLQNIVELSLLEANLLAARWSAHAAQTLSMKDAQQEELRQNLFDELERVFLRAHSENADPGWHHQAFLEVIELISQRAGSTALRLALLSVLS